MTAKRLLRWYGIIHKRLLKKLSFLLILCLIPLTALFLARVSGQESGILRVALAQQDDDATATAVVEALQEKQNVISVTLCTEEAALRLVAEGEADSAWILQENLSEHIHAAASGESATLVRVVSREDNIFTRAAREKLYGALFLEIAQGVFADFVSKELPRADYTQSQLRQVLQSKLRKADLVTFVYADFSPAPRADSGLLLSPLRGLLSVVMLLAGMAATMYFKQDEGNHVYDMLPIKYRTLVLFGMLLAALSLTAVFVTLALILSGAYTSFWQETACMLAFILAAAGFCSILGTLCPHNAVMGIALPLVLVLTMTFCPVFVNVKRLRFLQIFLPPYYYLYGIRDLRYVLEALVFAALSSLGTGILYPILCRKRNL